MMQVHICLNCQRPFRARADALTCSDKCRVERSRRNRKAHYYSVNSLSPQSIAMLNDLSKVSPRAYNRIMQIITTKGATWSEDAIYAAYAAADDCITILSTPAS